MRTGALPHQSHRAVQSLLVVLSIGLTTLALPVLAQTRRISVAPDGGTANGWSTNRLAVSGDGGHVAFTSLASNLVPDDTNGVSDAFVFDTTTNSVSRAGLANDGAQPDGVSAANAISRDGRFVAFTSQATNLVIEPTNADASSVTRSAPASMCISATACSERPSGCLCHQAASSQTVIRTRRRSRQTVASWPLPHWPPTSSRPTPTVGSDVFVRDRLTGQTTRVSVGAQGAQAIVTSPGLLEGSSTGLLSDDGRFVVFQSIAENLTPDPVPYCSNLARACGGVFVHDRVSATTQLVSVPPGGALWWHGGQRPRISRDARYVTFEPPNIDIWLTPPAAAHAIRRGVPARPADGGDRGDLPVARALRLSHERARRHLA